MNLWYYILPQALLYLLFRWLLPLYPLFTLGRRMKPVIPETLLNLSQNFRFYILQQLHLVTVGHSLAVFLLFHTVKLKGMDSWKNCGNESIKDEENRWWSDERREEQKQRAVTQKRNNSERQLCHVVIQVSQTTYLFL